MQYYQFIDDNNWLQEVFALQSGKQESKYHVKQVQGCFLKWFTYGGKRDRKWKKKAPEVFFCSEYLMKGKFLLDFFHI